MEMIIQGRKTTEQDIQLAQRLLQGNPGWSRTRLSQELCIRWDWRNQKGDLKDMACRSFLRKLEERGFLTLPAPRLIPRSPRNQTDIPHGTDPIAGSLRNLMPVTVTTVQRGQLPLYRCLLERYHYLRYHSVGQNMKYMVFDKDGTPVSCLLFGSAAWKSAPRDEYIGWSQEARGRSRNDRYTELQVPVKGIYLYPLAKNFREVLCHG